MRLVLILTALSIICEAQIDKKKAFFLLNSSAQADPAGLKYLKDNAKFFHDFTTQTGADGSTITSVADLSGNGVTASNAAPAQNPKVLKGQYGKDIIPLFQAFASSGTTQRDILMSSTFGENEFKSDFEILWVDYQNDEGNRDLFGVATGTNIIRANINANKLRFEYRYSAVTARRFVADTDATLYSAGVRTGPRLYRIKCDFTNDVFKVWIDGVEYTTTSLVDAFSTLSPALWANTTNRISIGGYNNGGTIVLYANQHLMKNFAVTPILTDQEVLDVSDYLMNGDRAGKRVIPFSSVKNNPIRKTTSNTTHTFGFALSEAPSSSVTVTLTGSLSKYTRSASSFTFTTSNWMTPQSLTLTAVADGVTDKVLTDQVIFTCSGGGYDGVTLTLPVVIYDDTAITNIQVLFGFDTWSETVHVNSGNAAAKRQTAIDYFFNGDGLPTGTANVTVTTGFSGAMHTANTSTIAGASSIDRFTITWTDPDGATWTHYAFHIKAPTGGNTKLLLDIMGAETADAANHDLLIETAMSNGVDVLLLAMPVCGVNSETSAKVTSIQNTGWNQMVSNNLDNSGYSAVELFMFDIAGSLNRIEANYSYTSIGITGIHAGAWSSVVAGSLFNEITHVFPIRGLNPIALDSGTGPFPLGDNVGTNGATLFAFYTNTVSLIDYFAMCALTKYIKQMDQTIDTSSSFTTYRYWKPLLEQIIGVTYEDYVSTSAGESTSAYYAGFITEILSEL